MTNSPGLKILAALIVGFGVSSGRAFAGGAASVPTPAPQAPAADGCTNDFKLASTYFQAALGPDASLDRIPAFNGEYSIAKMKISSENKIREGGGSVFLEVKLSMLGVVFGAPINVPVKICKADGKLSATLVMSSAIFKNPGGDKPVHDTLKDLPAELVIGISRNDKKEVVFKSETYPNQPASTVTVK